MSEFNAHKWGEKPPVNPGNYGAKKIVFWPWVTVSHLLAIFLPMAVLIVSGWLSKPKEQIVTVTLINPQEEESGPRGDGTPPPMEDLPAPDVPEAPEEEPEIAPPDPWEPLPSPDLAEPEPEEPKIDIKKLQQDLKEKQIAKEKAAEKARIEKEKKEKERKKKLEEERKRREKEQKEKEQKEKERKEKERKEKERKEREKREAEARARAKAEADAKAKAEAAEKARQALTTGTPGKNPGALNPTKDGPVAIREGYENMLNTFIKAKWEAPNENQLGGRKPIVKIYLKIAPGGKVEAARFEQKSGVPAMDNSVEKLLSTLRSAQAPDPKAPYEIIYELNLDD